MLFLHAVIFLVNVIVFYFENLATLLPTLTT